MTTGLVLEGGGMRGAYTAGVLQALFSENIDFGYVIGVSAGALTAVSYIAGQPRRNYEIFVKYANDPRYMGFGQLRATGNMFNFDFALREISEEHLPLDKDAFFSSKTRFVTGTTDIESGSAVYWDKEELLNDDNYSILKASSSLPLLADIVEWKGHKLMDGGLAAPIPYDRAFEDGCDKLVVVLTRDRDFVSKKSKDLPLVERKYADYPKFIEIIKNRYILYNEQRERLFELEKQGKAIVIAPRKPIKIARYERRSEPLAALHDRGMIDAAYKLDDIRRIL